MLVRLAPFTPIGIHALPLGKLSGQKSPLATGAQQVQHRAKYLVQVHTVAGLVLRRTLRSNGSISANCSLLMSLEYFVLFICVLSAMGKNRKQALRTETLNTLTDKKQPGIHYYPGNFRAMIDNIMNLNK